MEYYTSKELKDLFKVNSVTLYHWRTLGKLDFIKINNRKILYSKASVHKLLNIRNAKQEEKSNVIYCRVSNQKQKNDLQKQQQLLSDYCNSKGIIIDKIYSEIASGMNENRIEFNKLIKDVIDNKIQKIFITYKDRLTRFGFDYFKNIFSQYNCEIIVLNNKIDENSFEEELIKDLIDIIHHFSMKVYSNRRKHLKHIEEELKQ